MARPRHPAPEDLELWRTVTRDVTPLRPRPADPVAPEEPTRFAELMEDAGPAPAPAPASAPRPEPPVPSAVPSAKSAQVPGLDRRTKEKLRRGEFPIEMRLDLHGRTQLAAHEALVHFVAAARHRGARCVLVITGKGEVEAGTGREGAGAGQPRRGVLRRLVPRWLSEPGFGEVVLAHGPAQPRHGGDGALYVLLRRVREG